MRQNIVIEKPENAIDSHHATLENEQNQLRAILSQITRKVSPVWPIENFIACNPLKGFESMSFEDAVAAEMTARQNQAFDEKLERVNWHMIKWCGSFLDLGQGTIELPHRHRGFYHGFLKLAVFDRNLHQKHKETKDWLSALPLSPEQTILICLKRLNVSRAKHTDFLEETLSHLPGWAGYIQWLSEWHQEKETMPINLTEFLAVRLVLTCILWPEAAEKKPGEKKTILKKLKNSPQAIIKNIKKKESDYKNVLLNKLEPELKSFRLKNETADVQMLFCIDVRSEPLRRKIENLGCYETFGVAGFFGLAVKIKDYETKNTKNYCPALINAQFCLHENPLDDNNLLLNGYKKKIQLTILLKQAVNHLKNNVSTPFALAEVTGIWCGLSLFLKSCFPVFQDRIAKIWKRSTSPSAQYISLDKNDHPENPGIPLNAQIHQAETTLRLIGLIDNFSKIVLLVGHGSQTENNAYAASLDCGACGGNPGGKNAKILASILNKKDIREALAAKGIMIPTETVFYAAEHNSTTDHVQIFIDSPIEMHIEILEKLKADLEIAARNNQSERLKQLKEKEKKKKALILRSRDWSETRAEWGLARNAAFVIGPRQLTKNIDLDGRSFLHSYDFRQDRHGTVLEQILTAPLIVAHWINMQYLFSSIDNIAYGSGSKITHNIVGKASVMQGNASDLMHGLPLQSLMHSDDSLYHEPQRLFCIVYCPRDIILTVINRHPALQNLIFNRWLHLLVIDPFNHQMYQLDKKKNWQFCANDLRC